MCKGKRGRRTAALCLALLLALSAAALAKKARSADRTSPLTVACGDDLAGILFSELLEGGNARQLTLGLEYVSLGDCCGSNAQFALSTGEVDVAVLCPDAAAELLESGAYTDCGAVLLDGNVLVTRPDSPAEPAVIGYMNQREEQRQLLEVLYDPGTVRLQPMFPSGLPYALENGAVDAIVLDASAALRLGYPAKPLSEGVVTSALIVRSALLEDPRLQEFLQQYRNFADSLSDDAVLSRVLCRYLETDRPEEVIHYWKTMNVQFGSPAMGTD